MKINFDISFPLISNTGSMSGQVVWITGASSGIGEEIAYHLARAGCKLVLSARRARELERVKQTCVSQGLEISKKSFNR